MHRHIADQLDSVVGSQHKAFPLDSVHFSHCRGTQCENYYAIGLKKKKIHGSMPSRYQLTQQKAQISGALGFI